MKSKLFLFAVCALFLTPSISSAYQATFTPRISVSEEYTDNFFLTDNNKEDEYITHISPGFTAELLGKTSGAEFSYDPSYVRYNQYDDRNTWRHRAQFSGWSNIAKYTRVDVRDAFLYTEDPLIDDNVARIRTEEPTTPIDSTIRKSRKIYYTNAFSVNLNHQFGKDDSFRLGYTHRLLNNDDPSFEDNQSHNPSAGLTYWFGPQWGFEVNGSYTRGEYDISDDRNIFHGDVSLLKRFTKHFQGYIRYSHAIVDYEGETEDDKTYNPSIGLNYDIAKDISLSFDAGYFYNDYKLRESESNFNGDLRLIKKFKRGSMDLTASGGYDYAFFGAENLGFSLFYEAGVSATYQLAKHVIGNVFGSYRYDEYKDTIPQREDRNGRLGLGLTWQALPWMSAGLDYRFRSLDSTIDANDYDENRVLVRITLSPAQPYRTSKY